MAVCDVILDLDDDNWQNYFIEDELHEINDQVATNHQPFPEDMQNYLDLVPKTIDVAQIFKFPDNQQKTIDPVKSLIFMVACYTKIICMFIYKQVSSSN